MISGSSLLSSGPCSASKSGNIFNGGRLGAIDVIVGSMPIGDVGASFWLIISGLTLVNSFINSPMSSMPCALMFTLMLGGGVSGFESISIGAGGISPHASTGA